MDKLKIVEYTTNIGDYGPERQDLLNINNCSIFNNNWRNSRAVKILCHKYIDADISIYYDANILRTSSLDFLINSLGDNDMLITKSYKKIKDEFELAINRVPENEKPLLIEQKEHYKNLGILEYSVYGFQPLVRRHSKLMEEFNNEWWAEICRYSYRDQVSFPLMYKKYKNILRFKECDLSQFKIKTYKNKYSL